MATTATTVTRRTLAERPKTMFYTRTATRWESFKGWLWRVKFRINRHMMKGWEWVDDETKDRRVVAITNGPRYKYNR